LLGTGGPLGFVGVSATAGLSVGYAINIREEDNLQISNEELLQRWTGPTSSFNIDADVGGSLFRNQSFEGVTVSVGLGYGVSLTRFHTKRVSGPYVVSNIYELGHLFNVYAMGRHYPRYLFKIGLETILRD
jgi:hypothetical protein